MRVPFLPVFIAATGATLLGALPAQAVSVTVNGTPYDVLSFVGSYNNNSTRFTTAAMPWLGDSSLAASFALALGDGLGTPNSDGAFGPVFATSASLFAVFGTFFVPSDGTTTDTAFSTNNDLYTIAYVAPAPPAAVPGPLPLFGAAGAFAWSRRLRARAGVTQRQKPQG